MHTESDFYPRPIWRCSNTIKPKALAVPESPSDAKEWIVQRCIDAWKNIYEDWPGYDAPKTRDEVLEALAECNKKWLEYEFRGHRVKIDSLFSRIR
ncbi:MAG: hypothetical protein ACK4PR_02675 [Gammaproteobacteria bacterium]